MDKEPTPSLFERAIFAALFASCTISSVAYWYTDLDMHYEYLEEPFLHTVPILCALSGYLFAWKCFRLGGINKNACIIAAIIMLVILWIFLPKPVTLLDGIISIGMSFSFIISYITIASICVYLSTLLSKD